MERLAGKGKSARKEMQSLIKTGAFVFLLAPLFPASNSIMAFLRKNPLCRSATFNGTF